MGLDMYLTRKQYVKDWDHTPEEERKNAEVRVSGKKIDTSKLCYLEFDAAYWRKANHIHQWFVENIQDGVDNCEPYYVPTKKLMELRDLCFYILKDKDKSNELLPTQEGFFFGGTDYDEYYFEDISNTYEALNEIIKCHPDDDFYYRASW